ncbi:MAG: hypothetical protein R6U97_01380, partial [Desulfosalsimonas sp.]
MENGSWKFMYILPYLFFKKSEVIIRTKGQTQCEIIGTIDHFPTQKEKPHSLKAKWTEKDNR